VSNSMFFEVLTAHRRSMWLSEVGAGPSATGRHRVVVLSSLQPVFNLQSRHPSELGDIVRHAHRVDSSRMRGDQHVVRANGRASPLEGHTNRRIDAFDIRFEGSDRHCAQHGLNLPRELPGTALGGAVPQFTRDDDTRQHIRLADVGDVIGHGPLRLANEMGEDVRIEQIQTWHVRTQRLLARDAKLAGTPRRGA
jgi:hypothetical protein